VSSLTDGRQRVSCRLAESIRQSAFGISGGPAAARLAKLDARRDPAKLEAQAIGAPSSVVLDGIAVLPCGRNRSPPNWRRQPQPCAAHLNAAAMPAQVLPGPDTVQVQLCAAVDE